MCTFTYLGDHTNTIYSDMCLIIGSTFSYHFGLQPKASLRPTIILFVSTLGRVSHFGPTQVRLRGYLLT